MKLKIALAGNPNSGKTTLFNALTGSNQFVGNWPGVTVEKKEGRLKKQQEVTVTDLPGIYSLSPYTPEEIVARDYLLSGQPDAILNIVDGTNLERNLYLTSQLTELGLPVVVAINMMDAVEKAGEQIDVDLLAERLGCTVVKISALKGEGVSTAAEAVVHAAKSGAFAKAAAFRAEAEHAVQAIEAVAAAKLPPRGSRWYAVKLFERDERVNAELALSNAQRAEIEKQIAAAEESLADDAESIIVAERYQAVSALLQNGCHKKAAGGSTVSDRIDRVVTNRFAALPIFAAVMFLVYFISVSTVGSWATNWANDGVFGDGWHLLGIGSAAYSEAAEAYGTAATLTEAFEAVADKAGQDPQKAVGLTAEAVFYDEEKELLETVPVTYSDYLAASAVAEPDPAAYGVWVPGIPALLGEFLERVHTAEWMQGLILNGIVAGVGAVLGFVPQMLVLFLLLAFLEACGYMARIAFVMDRIFRKFGLSGKSFIPMLVGTGCGVPGIMASRTIENENDRRMTIITTTFIPCGAKLPIIALVAGAMFGGAWWVAPSAYFVGIAAIVVSGVLLKKTRLFAGDPAPFVMEMPAYHWPTLPNLLCSMWERGSSFIKKAGTVILLATIVIWFGSNFGLAENGIGMVAMQDSFLAVIGRRAAFIFAPLGWGSWEGAVAAFTGLIAKENVVGTFGVLFGGLDEVAENGWQIWQNMRTAFTPLAAYSFLVFNLLCAPCFAAMGAIRREMNSAKWTAFAIGYQCAFAYGAALVIYQLGGYFTGEGSAIGRIAAVALLAGIIGLLLRREPAAKMKKQTEKESAYALDY